ncbi:MAG TPA: ATP-dependent helicase [Trebonia sp.]|jgi:DNA helicase-2/ATP-dependent DNA helicase PcrA|nr:ATP-dependent helicase [Trebonia sp.]
MDADQLLAALDPEQRAVALACRGPVCVLAGAGTGKTRAITHRIAYAVATGVANPRQVMALTFTVRAAGELRGRLRALGGGAEAVRATTFHAAALRQLSYFWPRVIGGRAPQLVESKLPLLREAARDLGLSLSAPALSEAVTEIEWAKVCQVHPDSYVFAAGEAGRAPSSGVEDIGRLYGAYEALRRDRQLIDFESVLELTAAVVLTEPAVAREVHSAFRYFTVDEFQDVNPLQKLLLDAWLGGREELCVVGDPRQTIYSFTGATSEYLREFTSDYPSASMVRLMRDYRSTPQVVHVANRLMANDDELVAQRPTGPEPAVTKYADEEAEAAGVAASIGTLINTHGVKPSEIAVLLRINAHMERFERALNDAKIPYVVRGAERFYDRPEVRQALVLIRGAARAAGAGTDATGLPGELPAAVRHVLASAGLTPAPPATRGAVHERWESLSAIAGLADALAAANPAATLAEFAAELAERAETGHAPVAAAVTLATMHAAKGLEWDAVLVPGLIEGIMPIVHARTAEAVEEERRLLYVAVTRARIHLALSWAPARTPGAESTRQKSRFLAAMQAQGTQTQQQAIKARA